MLFDLKKVFVDADLNFNALKGQQCAGAKRLLAKMNKITESHSNNERRFKDSGRQSAFFLAWIEK